jgi:hypothetical protein
VDHRAVCFRRRPCSPAGQARLGVSGRSFSGFGPTPDPPSPHRTRRALIARRKRPCAVPWLVIAFDAARATADSDNRRLDRTRITLRPVRAYALVEFGDSEAIDLFLREEDAERALEERLRDEPQWTGLLRVEPVELDERDVSPN